MRKFKITEEQYNHAIDEGVVLNAPVSRYGDVNTAVKDTMRQAEKDGLKKDDYKIQVDPTEGRILNVRQLREDRMRVLKENSRLYTFNDFIKGKQ